MNGGKTPDLTVRAYAGEEDTRAIAALHDASAQVDGPQWWLSEQDVRQRLADPRVRPGENLFLFEVQGQPVAYGRLELEEGPEAGVFFTRGLVHPRWRRRGIGRQVMQRLEQRARERLAEVTAGTVTIGGFADLALEDRCGQDGPHHSGGNECDEDGAPVHRPGREAYASRWRG